MPEEAKKQNITVIQGTLHQKAENYITLLIVTMKTFKCLPKHKNVISTAGQRPAFSLLTH